MLFHHNSGKPQADLKSKIYLVVQKKCSLNMGHFIIGHDKALIVYYGTTAFCLSRPKSVKDSYRYNVNFWYLIYNKSWWWQRKIWLGVSLQTNNQVIYILNIWKDIKYQRNSNLASYTIKPKVGVLLVFFVSLFVLSHFILSSVTIKR